MSERDLWAILIVAVMYLLRESLLQVMIYTGHEVRHTVHQGHSRLKRAVKWFLRT